MTNGLDENGLGEREKQTIQAKDRETARTYHTKKSMGSWKRGQT